MEVYWYYDISFKNIMFVTYESTRVIINKAIPPS